MIIYKKCHVKKKIRGLVSNINSMLTLAANVAVKPDDIGGFLAAGNAASSSSRDVSRY